MGMVNGGLAVSGRLRVEGHPGVVVNGQAAHATQDLGVDGATAMGSDRLFHGESGDLMTKPQPRAVADEQPGRHELIDDRRRTGRDRLQQPQLDPGADQRRDVKNGARLPAQAHDPGQHRIPSRGRNRTHAGPDHLGDEERVSGGEAVELARIEPASSRKHADRVR